MAEKEELLEQLRVLGERLAAAEADAQAKNDAYKMATKDFEDAIKKHDDEIHKLQSLRDLTTEAERTASDEANMVLLETRKMVLGLWTSIIPAFPDAPKTIKAETWSMQLRVNRALAFAGGCEKEIAVRLKDLNKESIIKFSFDKTKLKALVEADLFDRSIVWIEENPSLVFTPKGAK